MKISKNTMSMEITRSRLLLIFSYHLQQPHNVLDILLIGATGTESCDVGKQATLIKGMGKDENCMAYHENHSVDQYKSMRKSVLSRLVIITLYPKQRRFTTQTISMQAD
jgi:hypothetical protein